MNLTHEVTELGVEPRAPSPKYNASTESCLQKCEVVPSQEVVYLMRLINVREGERYGEPPGLNLFS